MSINKFIFFNGPQKKRGPVFFGGAAFYLMIKVSQHEKRKNNKRADQWRIFNVSRRNFRKKSICLSEASLCFLGNEPLET